MEKVTTLLSRKEPHFKFVSPKCTLDQALSRMNCEGTDHLVVIDEEGKFLGVVTEHDIASKALLTDLPLSKTTVKKLVNRELPIASTDDTVEQCLQRMRQHNVRLMPIFENFHFIVIISGYDIFREGARSRTDIFDDDTTAVY